MQPQDSEEIKDQFHDECGVIGILNDINSGYHAVMALHSLQHRGQEASGVYSYDGISDSFNCIKRFGTVISSFSQEDVDGLTGLNSIGHVRYSTSGDKGEQFCQPCLIELDSKESIVLAHNGNLTNNKELMQELAAQGVQPETSIDTETIGLLIKMEYQKTKKPVQDIILQTLPKLKGAYSLVIMSKGWICAIRDPYGIRPLFLGLITKSTKANESELTSYIIASESCAISANGGKLTRDIEPGEALLISNQGLTSHYPFKEQQSQPDYKSKFCIFEYIYFSRPDSIIEGRNVYSVRKAIGRQLAKESHVEADVVVPVPDSGIPASIGFSQESNTPIELGLIRSHYIGRTFIDPTAKGRSSKVRMKHSVNVPIIEGKKVILVDDSIVRGTTSRKIVKMLRNKGAKEIHMRISSPPTRHSCFYGIDTPNSQDLIAHSKTAEEIAVYLGVDSLIYISLESLRQALHNEGDPEQDFCDACFSGKYFV